MSSHNKAFEMKCLIKALDENKKKRQRSAGSVSEADRKELADFYERELAKYATTKHGGGKAFSRDDEREDGEDIDDTDLAAGSESDGTDSEEETAEDREFLADSETEAGSDDDDDEEDEDEFTGGSDEDD